MKIYIGSDHRGFALKQQLKQWLIGKRYLVKDVGANRLDPNDDYPIISEKLGKAVVTADNGFGILLCGSGVGASAAVNKIDGVRGAIGISADQVRAGRHDDNMNVLILPADIIEFSTAKTLVEAFFATSYIRKKRYERRIKEIQKLEEKS